MNRAVVVPRLIVAFVILLILLFYKLYDKSFQHHLDPHQSRAERIEKEMTAVNRILILGLPRSGSTLIAAILSAAPTSVFFFEPFHQGVFPYDLSKMQVKTKVSQRFEDIFDCRESVALAQTERGNCHFNAHKKLATMAEQKPNQSMFFQKMSACY